MNEMITSEKLQTCKGTRILGKVEEIAIVFGIKDPSTQKDIFHTHFILIVTRKNDDSRIQSINECDDVVLNRIFLSDNETELCWYDNNWQEAVADEIDHMWSSTDIDYVSDHPLQERLQEIRDKVIGLIEDALK